MYYFQICKLVIFSENNKTAKLCVIFTKKLKFKWLRNELKDGTIGPIWFPRLFVPGILPKYAFFWDKFKRFFEEEIPFLNSILKLVDEKIEIDEEFLK